MSYPLIGAIVGLAFAIVEYFMFGIIIERGRQRSESGPGPRYLDMIRKAQIVAFPIAGWIVGSVLA